MTRRQRYLTALARVVVLVTAAACILPQPVNVSAETVNGFPLPSVSLPADITNGPDGALWFTESLGNKIGRMTTAGTVTNEFGGLTAGANPSGITDGGDGNLWFTETDANKIGKITQAGVVTEFSIPTANSGPLSITKGPDGALWFTESTANKIGRIPTTATPQAPGITEFNVPTGASNPARIASGPAGDNSLWFTESAGNKIGKINATTFAIQEFALTLPVSSPSGITLGSDNNLWFSASGNLAVAGSAGIGKITTAGAITMFANSNAAYAGITIPGSIVKGSDNQLWFTQSLANNIGHITTAGAVGYVTLPAGQSVPTDITSGSDGALWFTEPFVSKIGKVVPAGAGGGATLNGTVTFDGLAIGTAAYQVQLTVKLLQPGTENVTGGTFTPTTDVNGNFTINGLPPGTYDIDVKSATRVSRRAFNVVIAPGATVNRPFGTLLAGDINASNFINSADYVLLRATFGLSQGDAGYDPRADLNGSGFVNSADYVLLRANFGAEGPLPAP